MINVLSLFDWISCARVALERAWIKVHKYFASEIDKYAIQVAQKNRWCYYNNLWDVRGFQSIMNADLTPIKFDLLIWWSPCQDLSIAKKNRKWLDGERSSLFREYVRILWIVKPRYFLLENVASMSKENQNIISEALGVDPIMINASLVSGQNRKRLFWTNIEWITQPDDKKIYWKYWQYRRTYWRESKGWKCPTLTANMWTWWNNVPYREIDWEKIKLTPEDCEVLQWLPEWYTDSVSKTQRYKMLWNAFNVDVVAHILSFMRAKDQARIKTLKNNQ